MISFFLRSQCPGRSFLVFNRGPRNGVIAWTLFVGPVGIRRWRNG